MFQQLPSPVLLQSHADTAFATPDVNRMAALITAFFSSGRREILTAHFFVTRPHYLRTMQKLAAIDLRI